MRHKTAKPNSKRNSNRVYSGRNLKAVSLLAKTSLTEIEPEPEKIRGEKTGNYIRKDIMIFSGYLGRSRNRVRFRLTTVRNLNPGTRPISGGQNPGVQTNERHKCCSTAMTRFEKFLNSANQNIFIPCILL